MLLRRVTRHIRNQDWFAVCVDFLIVVVGVFVGLQVQDWNDSRKERIEEQELLVRLHEETVVLLEEHRQELEDLELRSRVLTGANPVLFSTTPVRDLSDVECRYVTGSHVFRRPADELPVLDEMLASGRFGILTDAAVKARLRNYVLLRGRARGHYDEAVNELFRLHSRFPDLIEVLRVPDDGDDDAAWGGLAGEGFRWLSRCNVEEMRANTAFLNELADNLSRINSLIRFTVARQELLVSLEQLVAARIER